MALAPNDAASLRALGHVRLRQDRPAEAAPLFDRAVGAAGGLPNLLNAAALARLRAGEPKAAVAACVAALARDPTDQAALAYLGLAFRLLESPAEAELNDYDGLVLRVTLQPPASYGSPEAFNRALGEALAARHQPLAQAPIDQSLRHGTQTVDRLFTIAGEPAVQALRGMIDHAIATACAGLTQRDDHPFLARLPASGKVRYTGSWSSRLGSQGYHTDHFHPQGWISGVYYIDVPAVCAGAADHQGWLKFGDPAIGPEIRLPWKKAIEPVAGTLVLFPSYFWHGTLPFQSTQPRLTVAFDAVPV